MAKTYNFKDQLAVGDQGEQVLDSYFLSKGYDISEVDKEQQRRGIDRIMINPAGELLSIEYKTDAITARTGNVFIETISSTRSGALGWAMKTHADYVIYYVPNYGKALVLKPDYLRNKVPFWIFEYKQRPVKNPSYMSWGIPVPWVDLAKDCKVLDINSKEEC